MLLGSKTERARQRVVDSYDGWIPIGITTQELSDGIADLRVRAQRAGRDPDSLQVSFFWPRNEADHLKRLRDLGVARVVLAVPAITEQDRVLARLDRYAALAREVG